MAINFPSSPANNAIWPTNPTSSGVAYTARSSVWRDIYGRADRFNRAVNGFMQMSQQNGMTDGTVSSLQMADEFQMFYTSSAGVFRGQRVASRTPYGSNHRLRVTVTTPDAALVSGEYLAMATRFEGSCMADLAWGTSGGRQIILRFGFRGPAGTYCIALRNHAADRSYVSPFTISSGQANTDTEQIIVIPPCPTGTWPSDTTRWATLYWMLANANTTSSTNQWLTGNFAGATGMTNNIGTAANVFEMFDVSVYSDPNWTGLPPEWEVPDFGTELRRCQRYYCELYNLRGSVNTATTVARAGVVFPTPMRLVPSLTIRGTPHMYDGTALPIITSITANYSSTLSCDCDLTCAAGGFTGARRAVGYYDGSYANAIIANARM